MKPLDPALTRSTQAYPARDVVATSTSSKRSGATANGHRVLWIDGVGGYLLIDREDLLVGQATTGERADVAIVGDVSRQACAIRRSDSDYLLQPLQEMRIDDQAVVQTQLLRDGATLQLGNRVRLTFAKPNPLSGTARLHLASLHRFKPHVDGVLLLADSCILGPSLHSHIVCPTWSSELIMFKQAGGWQMRSEKAVEVDGQRVSGVFPFVAGMRVAGEDFSLSVE
jgi:hypothetical protein